MNKRSNILHYINTNRKSLVDSEFAEDIVFDSTKKNEESLINSALKEIHILIRNWSEGMDLASADTKKPTKYLNIFEMLFESRQKITYKEISQKVGGANIEKFVYKCNRIAIGKAMKMSKEDTIYKKIIERYYAWINKPTTL
ncbi:MAG: hypothetical protein FWC80_01210 [Firmicutes bacterium]|nr:hypothetical protein [Bacillota bacterium]